MTTERKGDWFATFSGKRFHVFDPRPEDVCIEDIAHALSHLCRFNGHTSSFYSVAQHCVLVSRWLSCLADIGSPDEDAPHAFWGLMHDAAEAYVGDMIWPMKRGPMLSNFKIVEHGVMVAICERFELQLPEPPSVKRADLVLLATEKRDLMAPVSLQSASSVGPEVTAARHAGLLPWSTDVAPMPERIEPWSPHTAEAAFLSRFYELTGGRFS